MAVLEKEISTATPTAAAILAELEVLRSKYDGALKSQDKFLPFLLQAGMDDEFLEEEAKRGRFQKEFIS